MKAWENNIRKVVPYVPGEQPKENHIIKLNTNENPYPPSDMVAKELKAIGTDDLRKYPDPTIGDLTRAIAEYYNVSSDKVFVGVGSDDVLAMIFMTFFNSKKPILFPEITYSFYNVWAKLFGIPYEEIPLDERLQIIPQDYTKENGGIIFPNPNAPTGEIMSLDEIEGIIRENQDVIVVVDEAYIDFGGESALALIDQYENLLVVQTFSKSRSMAGMRIGYAIGNATLIKYLNDVKYSFNSYTLDRISMRLGIAAIQDRKYFEETTAKIIKTREWTKNQLRELGFQFGDSQSNFLFVTHEQVKAEVLFEELKRNHIYVRHFKNPSIISNYLRISIGTQEEMEQLVEFLKKYKKGLL